VLEALEVGVIAAGGSSIRLWEELPQPCTRAQIDDCGVIID